MNRNNNNREEKRPISTSAVIRLVIWSLVLCILAGVFTVAVALESGGYVYSIFDDDFYDDDDDDDDERYHVGNGTVKSPVSEISIDWVAGSVTVLLTDGDEIRITEVYDGDNNDNRLRWQVDEGELSIRYCRKIRYSDKVEAKHLTVEIPRSAALLSELQISAVSATQDIRVSARELDIDTVSGNVTAWGDYDYVDVDTVSGQVRLVLPEDTTGFTVNRDSVSGRVEVNGFSFDSVGSNRWGDGSVRIHMDSVNGNLLIEKETEN